MIDYCLRAADKDALIAALPFLLSNDDGAVAYTERYALDLIGPLVQTEAVLSEDGETVVTPAVIDQRYHANLRLLDESLASQVPADLIVTPENPKRVWA